MTVAWDGEEDRRRERLKRSQPSRWEPLVSFIVAGLCAVALWKGIVWVGLVAYRYWH